MRLMPNMMLQIDELEKMTSSVEIRSSKAKAGACIYYPERSCSAPKMKFRICQTCPRCASLIPKSSLRALFNHIKRLAILLMNMMGGQASK